jgi:hypothetical protein
MSSIRPKKRETWADLTEEPLRPESLHDVQAVFGPTLCFMWYRWFFTVCSDKQK